MSRFRFFQYIRYADIAIRYKEKIDISEISPALLNIGLPIVSKGYAQGLLVHPVYLINYVDIIMLDLPCSSLIYLLNIYLILGKINSHVKS